MQLRVPFRTSASAAESQNVSALVHFRRKVCIESTFFYFRKRAWATEFAAPLRSAQVNNNTHLGDRVCGTGHEILVHRVRHRLRVARHLVLEQILARRRRRLSVSPVRVYVCVCVCVPVPYIWIELILKFWRIFFNNSYIYIYIYIYIYPGSCTW